MSYLLKTFDAMTGTNTLGNTVANKLNQWLSFNPGVTPMDMSIAWPEGRSRAGSWVATLLYRQGGQATRFWSSLFSAPVGVSPESRVNTFLANNPTIIPTLTVVIERPGTSSLTRSILLVYAVGNWAQIASGPRALVGTPLLPVGVASYGDFADSGDPLRPNASALNLGNVIWPAGASGFLFSTSSNNPDQDALAGVAPCCAGAPPPPAPPSVPVLPLCGHCLPPRIL